MRNQSRRIKADDAAELRTSRDEEPTADADGRLRLLELDLVREVGSVRRLVRPALRRQAVIRIKERFALSGRRGVALEDG